MTRSPSCARVSGPEPATRSVRVRPLLVIALAALGAAVRHPARADQQRDPQLQAVVAKAIAEAQCFTDQYDSAVWYTLMEPRLRRIIREKDERLDILKQVYCETHRRGEARLPPGLVMALIDVESRFDRYAVSAAGAVGLMQVMPFWPRSLGVENRLFGSVEFNVRLGCEILAYYMLNERNDYRRALSRYNGSSGRREYPDLVLGRLSSRWRA